MTRTLKALSIVFPGGTKIRDGLKTLEVRRWQPDSLPLKDLLIVENYRRLSVDQGTLGSGDTLLNSVLRIIHQLSKVSLESIFFLYSDIGLCFYEQHGFQLMPARYQTAQGSALMVLMLPEFNATVLEEFRDQIPLYF